MSCRETIRILLEKCVPKDDKTNESGVQKLQKAKNIYTIY